MKIQRSRAEDPRHLWSKDEGQNHEYLRKFLNKNLSSQNHFFQRQKKQYKRKTGYFVIFDTKKPIPRPLRNLRHFWRQPRSTKKKVFMKGFQTSSKISYKLGGQFVFIIFCTNNLFEYFMQLILISFNQDISIFSPSTQLILSLCTNFSCGTPVFYPFITVIALLKIFFFSICLPFLEYCFFHLHSFLR